MLGTRIAALRREAGLSQAELAQRLQVSPSALGMYEQERREPSMQTLVKLSRELGVTTDYLLTGTPAEKEQEELEKMLLGRIRAADQRLEQLRQEIEQEKANALAAQDARFADARAKLERAYSRYGDNWVDTLFRQAVGMTP